jgi:8-oxo-dGTP diphosphatase
MAAPETPKLTVDTIIELDNQPGRPIVLIERKNPPFGWALPGGFVDIGESLEAAAVREAREETCLDVRLLSLLGCYSDPQRDPRGHTVSAVYIAAAAGTPVAADDAKSVSVFDIKQLPTELAFDHGRILADYLGYRENGQLPLPAAE